MQDKTSVSVTEAASSYAVLARVFARVDRGAWLAVALLFAGWFLLNTFTVDLGFATRGHRFFDISSLIETPARLFTGVRQRGPGTIWFGLLCGMTLLSPLVPHLWRDRRAWLGMVVPGVLIIVCMLLVYARVYGGDAHSSGADTIGSDLRHLGRHVLDSARAVAARRVTLAAGAYVAALGSLYLAVLGIRGYRNHRH